MSESSTSTSTPLEFEQDIELVELVIDITTAVGWGGLRLRLEELGFHPDVSQPSQWKLDDIAVTIVPPDPTIPGFQNLWHPSALAHPHRIPIPEGELLIIDAPHFCAVEFESRRPEQALAVLASLVSLMAARPQLVAEMQKAPSDVQEFVGIEAATLLIDPDFHENLGNLLGALARDQRFDASAWTSNILSCLQSLAADHRPRSVAPLPVESPATNVSFDWHPPSGVVRSAGYDKATQTLLVEFRRGGLYEYFDVPPLVYGAWKNAVSVGHYHTRWIRDRYRYRKVG